MRRVGSMERFSRTWKTTSSECGLHGNPSWAVNLFLDNLNVHKSRGIVEKFSLAGIILLFFPAGVTNVIQPLDKFPYAIFKGKLEFWTKKVVFHLKNAGLEANEIRIVAAINALHEAMTPKAIQEFFRPVGIYPFSIDVIQECARKAWGRPLSDEQIKAQHYGRAQKVQRNVREIWELLEERSKNFVDATLDGAAEIINVNLNVGAPITGIHDNIRATRAQKDAKHPLEVVQAEMDRGAGPSGLCAEEQPSRDQSAAPPNPSRISRAAFNRRAAQELNQVVLELTQLPRRGLECVKYGRRAKAEIRGATCCICKELSLCYECGSLRVEAHQSEGEERVSITCTHQKVLNTQKER